MTDLRADTNLLQIRHKSASSKENTQNYDIVDYHSSVATPIRSLKGVQSSEGDHSSPVHVIVDELPYLVLF